MDSRGPVRPSFAGSGLGGPVPRDVWILLGIVLGTFSLRFFASTGWLPAALSLTPAVWRLGFVWQLVTYPFIGFGQPGFWFLLELVILLLFARDVFWRLGRRRFWRLLVLAALGGAVVGILVDVGRFAIDSPFAGALPLLQGQRTLLAVLIAAFATLNGDATIYLFFVLPVRARWFLGLEILFAFLAFLGSRDLAGFLGICAAVAFTWWSLQGPGRGGREHWLRLQERWMRWRLAWLRRRRGLRVVRGTKDDPWLH
jgi:hypothetical protein